jgi:large subunit ribosomal protein L32e
MQGNEKGNRLDEKEETRACMPRQTNGTLGRFLTVRKTLKAKKPDFVRQESWRYKRVKSSWRRPRGIDSKMRVQKKGWPKSVDTGYRSPKAVRGLHPSGFEEVIVHTMKDLGGINAHKQAARIAHTVGKRKRATIIEKAEALKIHVLNKRV